MKKIIFIAVALIVALGGLGVGYAAWTDKVTITGNVETGTLDLEVVEYSGMWFWKIPGDVPEYYFTTDPSYVPTPIPGEDLPFIVAYAASSQTLDVNNDPVDDAVTMTFDNLFPLDGGVPLYGPGDVPIGSQYAWRANFVVHYNGSVPAMVSAEFTEVHGDAALLALWAEDPPPWNGIWVVFERLDATYDEGDDPWQHRTGIYITDTIQMHQCEYVLCWMCVEIPQNNDYQDLEGGFTAEINAIQWNEAP